MEKLLLKIFVKDYKNTEDILVRKKIGLLASYYGLITNFILFISKILIGSFLHLFSIVSDSINNLSDFGNNIISIFGVKISSKPADKDHPYGHQRVEYIISLVIGFVIIAFGLLMVYTGITNLIEFIKSVVSTGKPVIKSMSAIMFYTTIIILSIAILLKISQVYLYKKFSIRISSLQLKALSSDAFNDVLDTVAVLIGVFLSYFLHYDLDCFFTLFVSVFVIKSGIEILKDSMNELIGKKPDKELIESIKKHFENKLILGIHDLELHSYGHIWYGSISAEVNSSMSLLDAHSLIDEITRNIGNDLNVHISIHIDPIEVEDDLTNDIKNYICSLIEQNNIKCSLHDFRLQIKDNIYSIMFDLIIQNDFDLDNKIFIEQSIRNLIKEKYNKECKIFVNYEQESTELLGDCKVQ